MGKQNPRSSPYRMVYGRAGFYLSNYFLSRWMTYLIMLIHSDVGCYMYVARQCQSCVLCVMAPCAIAHQE